MTLTELKKWKNKSNNNFYLKTALDGFGFCVTKYISKYIILPFEDIVYTIYLGYFRKKYFPVYNVLKLICLIICQML